MNDEREACQFCGTDLGFYTDSFGVERCLNCYAHRELEKPAPEEAATLEPNRYVIEER